MERCWPNELLLQLKLLTPEVKDTFAQDHLDPLEQRIFIGVIAGIIYEDFAFVR